MSRRGSKSRSAPRSRPSSPSPARSGSQRPLHVPHPERLVQQAKIQHPLRWKENAQFKQEISRLATEIAEIRKLALKPPAPPAATSSSAMDTAEAPPRRVQ
ncbi:hypothetical protein MRX96_049947 [Rhipicephalus microplus]